ncbi:MAG: beta-ketoacyl synthase N-terminal-like domain-containing protein, partial [Promethearchaeota archaeon]
MQKPQDLAKTLQNPTGIWGYAPKGFTDISIAVELSRNGAIGLYDGEGLSASELRTIVKQFFKKLSTTQQWGIRITQEGILTEWEQIDNPKIPILPIIICAFSPSHEAQIQLRNRGKLIIAEVLTLEEAQMKNKWADLFLVKGNEAGGLVSNKNTFIQIQEFHKAGFSFIIEGGLGVFNVGATLIGGALGVVYEAQLYLLAESPLSQAFKDYIRSLAENDFYLYAESLDFNFRFIGKLANKAIRVAKKREKDLYAKIYQNHQKSGSDLRKAVLSSIEQEATYFNSVIPKHSFLPCDHGIIFAKSIARKFTNIPGFIRGMKQIISSQFINIQTHWPFQENSPLAQNLKIRYPIIQGAMANITESLEFAQMVADNGALPTFALGGLMGPEADQLLQKVASSELSKRPYMAGIIGLEVIKARRDAQLLSIQNNRVPFTLIAAGTTHLAMHVISQGQRVFFHTPALSIFKDAMGNRIEFLILEGSECGGHIGMLSSWILWENVLEFLDSKRNSIIDSNKSKVNIIFAGGIMNATSSAMLAMMLGNHLDVINPGIQMGTAYLFTPEIISGNALSPVYQNLLLNHHSTSVIGSTVNTRARVLPTNFSQDTIQREIERVTKGLNITKRKELYEKDNLGALRIASRAEIWNNDHRPGSGSTQFLPMESEKQIEKGAFMTGDCISLRNTIISVSQLHEDLICGGRALLQHPPKQFQFLGNQHYKEKSQILLKENETETSWDSRVAIIGLGGIFPDSPTIPQFWENILEGKYSITEVSPDRWDPLVYFNSDKSMPDKTYTKIGGFIKDFQFKSIKFRIPPQMADRMDFVQKWALTAAKEALTDASFPIDGRTRLNIAVIVGNALGGENQRNNDKRIFFNEIRSQLAEAERENVLPSHERKKLQDYLEEHLLKEIPTINEDTMPGELSNIIAGRICNVFNLTGKSMTIDAACASSLAALDTAVKGLLVGDYDVVLTGGADRSMGPSSYVKFCKIGALSARHSCPFDAQADGFVMGEGSGFVVLKRYSDAVKDKDRIYAVIRGIGAASDGRGKGITAPNPEGQKQAILRALKSAQIQLADLQYIECHGTSTVIGDATELKVLEDLLKGQNIPNNIAIGSVKSQIGHLKSAAAIASIIKTSLSLYHKVLPPSVNFNEPNPKIDWSSVPFYVNTTPIPWETDDGFVRRAGVSAFGFGGTNYHVILEETPLKDSNISPIMQVRPKWNPADSSSSIEAYKSPSKSIIQDMDICFLFSGQGSQYVKMGQKLYDDNPEIRKILNRANIICQDFGQFELLEVMFGSKNLTTEENRHRLTQTQYTQPAIFSLEIALTEYFKTQNITPMRVAGHSLGEFSALVTAGVLQFEDALKAVIVRGQAMNQSSSDVECTMAAVLSSAVDAQRMVKMVTAGNVCVSNFNSLTQTVISGDLPGIQQAIDLCTENNITAKRINVSQAFHSPYVAPAEEKLAKFLQSIEFQTPTIPVYSNVLGDRYPTNPDRIKEILIKQITSPVRWVKEIKKIHSDGGRNFLEVGPKKVLSYFTKDILKSHSNVKVNYTLSPKKPELQHLSEIISKLKPANVIQTPKSNGSSSNSKGISIVGQNQQSANHQFSILEKDPHLWNLSQQPYFDEFLKEQKDILAPMLQAAYAQFKRKKEESPSKNNFDNILGFYLDSIGITGVGLGLPGRNRNLFDDQNIEDLLKGMNFIDPISDDIKRQMLEKKITKLHKSPTGEATFIEVSDISQVLHLAGQIGQFNPQDDFLIDQKWLSTLDISYQMAMCAGLEALKDSSIPLVKSQITTSTGKILSGDWALPESLQQETGIIFSSTFPGYDNFVEEITAGLTQKFKSYSNSQILNFFTQLLNSISNSKLKSELEEWFTVNKSEFIENQDQNDVRKFNRAFVFRILSMGHAQFAQLIKAKGPNTQNNAACATCNQAIGMAEDWIRTGRCKRVIVISADNPSSESLLPWMGAAFVANGAGSTKQKWEDVVLPFGKGRNGMVIGSGAAAFVIEAENAYKNRGVQPIVDLLGTHFSNSAYHGSRLDKVHIPEEFQRFITMIEKRYGITKEELANQGMFVSHETFTPARGGSGEGELKALSHVFGDLAYQMLIINTKGFTGHAFGTGIEEAVAIKSMELGHIPPIANYTKIDPMYSRYNFSKGSQERKKYAIRFAAGFGSQVAMVLFRLNTPENRIISNKFNQWLKSIAGSEDLFLDGRVLKIKTAKKSLSFSIPIKVQPTLTIPKSPNIESEVKQIIADKTGYDLEDIDSNYDLEDDLGIDTIKQAEIFGDVREKWQIPEDTEINLADFRTILDILAFIQKLPGKTPVFKEIPMETVGNTEMEVKKIIADKTGYDLDDVDSNYDLEDDLGIDTIKQAEIFGEIREKWQISEDTEINLADFRTIQDILAFIQKLPGQSLVVKEFSSKSVGYTELEVKQIIADKTGYDLEDIDSNYDLEDDLGIDTIKQAEIFGDVREKWQIPENTEINLADFRTIQDILAFIQNLQSKKPILQGSHLDSAGISDFGENQNITEKKQPNSANIHLYSIQKVPFSKSNSHKTSINIDRNPIILINLCDYLEYYNIVKQNLIVKNVSLIEILSLGEKSLKEVFTEDLSLKITEITSKEYNICIVLGTQSDFSNITNVRHIFTSIFSLFRTFNLDNLESGWIVSNESLDNEKKSPNPLANAVSGFLKSLSKEFEFHFKHIYSLDAQKGVTEIFNSDPTVEVIIDADSKRHTLLRQELSLTQSNKTSLIETEDLLIVTGGARGITFNCIDELTNFVKPTLILLGRTQFNPEMEEYLSFTDSQMQTVKEQFIKGLKQQEKKPTPVQIKKAWSKFSSQLEIIANISHLKNKGLQVEYHSVDIVDKDQLTKVFSAFTEKIGKSEVCLVHGAGIEESKGFISKDLSRAELIVDVKLSGLANILEKIQPKSLKSCILFSSIAGRYGNQGQVDYAFANGYLSRYAWDSQTTTRRLAIDWSAWADVGMATQGSTMKVLEHAGVVPIPLQTGIHFFTQLVTQGYTGEYIVAGSMGAFESQNEIIQIFGSDSGSVSNSELYPMLTGLRYQVGKVSGFHEFNLKQDAYLLDHQIEGRAVIPGVLVMETFAEYYRALHGESLSILRDVEFTSPMKISQNKSVEVELDFNFDAQRVTLLSKTFPAALKGKTLIKSHFFASYAPSEKKYNVPKPEFFLMEPVIPLLTKEEIYSIFFHGPRFQVLE